MSQWSLSKLWINHLRIPGALTAALILFSGCTPDPSDKGGFGVQVESAPTTKTVEDRPIDRVEWPDEPLDDTPAVASFLSLVRSKDESLRAKVRLFNFTETDLVELEMELACKDQDGRALPCIKPWKTTRHVPARSHVSHVIGAHLPKEVDDIQVTMKGARFADGNRWPAQE